MDLCYQEDWFKRRGLFIGDEQFLKKKWEGVLESIEGRRREMEVVVALYVI